MANFTFICGSDDFLVNKKGETLFDKKSKSLQDDLSKEIISGAAQNTSEVEKIINQFQSAVQTLSLFAEKKVVWLKGITFLSDSVTGRSAGTKEKVESLQVILESVDPNSVEVILTASPIDRRTKSFKWLQKNSDYTFIENTGDQSELNALAREICKEHKIRISDSTLETLKAKVGNHTRLVLEELKKLATYLGPEGGEITEELVYELVPDFGDNDFFEAVEAFYSLDLNWTLTALKKHFFSQKESRPLLASLQNRNRLMLQLRVLLDARAIQLGFRGIDKSSFEMAAGTYQDHFGGLDAKSTFNIFTQNLWYLGKLGKAAESLSLRKLISFQMAFVQAFETVLKRPTEQEAVLREMAIQCLG